METTFEFKVFNLVRQVFAPQSDKLYLGISGLISSLDAIGLSSLERLGLYYSDEGYLPIERGII